MSNFAKTRFANTLEMEEPSPKCNCLNCQEKKIEQPNHNLMIITEIEGLMSQVNEKLEKLEVWHYVTKQKPLRSQALEEIDIFQKTTLFELRRSFE